MTGTAKLVKLAEAREHIDAAWSLLSPAQGNLDENHQGKHTDLMGVWMAVDEAIVETVVDLVNQGVIRPEGDA